MKMSETVNTGQAVGERHLLVAVDDSAMAEQAVWYVADILRGSPGFRVTLFHVIAVPPDDYFSAPEERSAWIDDARRGAGAFLSRYRRILGDAGFDEGKVAAETYIDEGKGVVETILEAHARLGACTIVVGRKGKSREEEFLFGSLSRRLLGLAKKCSLWVVE